MQPRLNDRPLARSPTKKTFAIPGSAPPLPPASGSTWFPQLSSCSSRPSADAAPETIASPAQRTGARLRATTGKNCPPCSSRKTPVLRPAQQTTSPRTTPPAQRPLNARMRDGMRARPAPPSLPPRFFPPNRPGNSRERATVPAKNRTDSLLFSVFNFICEIILLSKLRTASRRLPLPARVCARPIPATLFGCVLS